MPNYVLSESDKRILSQIIDWFKRHKYDSPVMRSVPRISGGGADIRRAKLTQDATSTTTITANLYDANGIEQTEGPESNVKVYCLFAHPTGALSEAIPRLHEGQDIFVIKLPYNEDGYVQMRWYCLTIFQRIDPVLTVQDGGLTTMLYLCS